jgi:peptide/nickel transport system permease protein
VGVASTLLGSFLGGVIGLLSGYFGGKLDLITQRVLDILLGLPLLVLALVILANRWGGRGHPWRVWHFGH